MQTTEELTVFFEQFDGLPSTPHLPIEVKLTLFSKLHYINNNEIDKIILIINTLFEKQFIDEEQVDDMLHENLSISQIFQFLIFMLIKSIPNNQYQDFFDILQFDDEKQKIFIQLDYLNIIYPDNFLLMLSYFCQYDLNPNLIITLEDMPKLKEYPCKKLLEKAHHESLKHQIECYISFIVIERNYELNPFFVKLTQNAIEPLLIANILNLEQVSNIFTSPAKALNMHLLEQSKCTENILMTLYLLETQSFPEPFIEAVRKQLQHSSQHDILQLHRAMTFLVMNPDIEFKDFKYLLGEMGQSYHIVKFYHALKQQHLECYFSHVIDGTPWLDREVLLNMFNTTLKKTALAKDITFFFVKHLPFAKSYEDSFAMFLYLIEHDVHEKDIGEECFHRLLFIHSKKVSNPIICFKKLNILSAELMQQLLSPDWIEILLQPKASKLFGEFPLDVLYEHFLQHYPTRLITKGLQCISILYKNNLLSLEHLKMIYQQQPLDQVMNFLEMYDQLGKLNEITLLNICSPVHYKGFFHIPPPRLETNLDTKNTPL